MTRSGREVAFAVLAVAMGAAAGVAEDLEEALRQRWTGAWVVTAVETSSDCAGFATNNEVRGELVRSKGSHAFEAGEVAQVEKLNVKSDRVDLFLLLGEPILLTRQDGPFTLYGEKVCKVQLMIATPKRLGTAADRAGVEEVVLRALKPFSRREEAQRSPSWNGRRRDPLPADYDLTLARHAAWRAEQENARFAQLRERATEDAAAALARVIDDPSYLAGFGAGVEAVRSWRSGSCSALGSSTADSVVRSAPRERDGDGAEDKTWRRGYRDGQELAYALTLLREVRGCFVLVPPVPDSAVR